MHEHMVKPVLILGSEPRVAVTIARSLHQHGIPVHVAALSDDEPRVTSRAVRSFLRLPSPQQKPDDFRTALVDIVRVHEIDMILPSNDSALMGLAQGYAEIVERLSGMGHDIHLGCPRPEVVHQVLDKATTLEIARRCGLYVPLTQQIGNAQQIEQLRSVLRFPVALKPRSKWHVGAAKVRYFQSYSELRRAVIREPVLAVGALVQEYCPGIGVGIEVLMHDQKPLAIFQHRRLKELPPTGGVSVLAESEPVDLALAEEALLLLRTLRWSGVAMVEFRYDLELGRAVLMEVNGRYWGSLPLSLLAGLEFPYYEWQLAHGQKPEVPERYEIGLRARWTRGSFLRAQELLRDPGKTWSWKTLVETTTDLLPPTRDMLWSSEDPTPAFIEVGRTIAGLLLEIGKAVLKILIPNRLFDLVHVYRLLGRRDGGVYVRRQLLRLFGLARETRRARCLSAPVRTILFVCHGNVMRSPMAARLLSQILNARGLPVSVRSAGLHAKPYTPADARALAIAGEFDCSLEDHLARMVTRAMVEKADVVFVMDRLNEAKLLGRFPEAKDKVLLLGAFDAEDELEMLDPDELDIVDPYDGELQDVRHCYEHLTRCVRRVASVLVPDKEISAVPLEEPQQERTSREPSEQQAHPTDEPQLKAQGQGPDVVSVIIPCYGQAQFLGEAIESVLAQTGADCQIIVVDDGSPDDTAQVAARYPRVEYIRQENRGVSAARNRGLQAANGAYVLFLDADDRLLPNHFQVSLDAFRTHPGAACVCGDYRWFGAEGTWHVHNCEPRPDYYGTLLRTNFIGPPHPVMFRRRPLLDAGGFRRDWYTFETLELYLRMARYYPLYCHHEVVAEYRRHAAQISMDSEAMLKGGMTALRAQRPYLDRDPRYREAYLAGVRYMQQTWGSPLVWEMVSAFREGRLRRAAHCFMVLGQFYPQGLVDLLHHKMTAMLHGEKRPA
jgi:protein-tyrosine-phosphatase/predicted ATP-grasp superfamily ATP-dependent carboligase